MRILMFVNWKVAKCDETPSDLQPPDYLCNDKPYWFFRHLSGDSIHVDVIDVSYQWKTWERFEANCLHFFIWQALKKLPYLHNYDLILSHGAQSAVFVAFLRSLMGTMLPPHIIIDIGALNGGRSGKVELILFRFAMKSVSGLLYHVRQQELHYAKYFPDLVGKSWYVPFGPDIDLFKPVPDASIGDFILSIGYAKRDWSTLISSYEKLPHPKPELKIVGDSNPIPGMLPDGVKATGRLPFGEMTKQIASARFVVVPLSYIPYAVGQMTVTQSMAMGKAVIVPEVPSMIDYIAEGHNGLFYDPGNVADLRDKMQYLLQNESVVKSLGKNARYIIEAKFNERQMAERIWEVISGIVKL